MGLPRVTSAFVGYWGDFIIAVLAAGAGGASPWALAQRIADEAAAIDWKKPTKREAWARKVAKWRKRKAARLAKKG